MSPTRVHDRHISLHLQGSLGERTAENEGLMGHILAPRSRALTYCHRNANACRKRQTPTASINTLRSTFVQSSFCFYNQDASRSLPFPETSEWRWFLWTARKTGKARKLFKSWRMIPLLLEPSSRASSCCKQGRLAIDCCYLISREEYEIKKDWYYRNVYM